MTDNRKHPWWHRDYHSAPSTVRIDAALTTDVLTSWTGGNDVFVDIGDKYWGVLCCQNYFGGIHSGKTIHIGDQFLSEEAMISKLDWPVPRHGSPTRKKPANCWRRLPSWMKCSSARRDDALGCCGWRFGRQWFRASGLQHIAALSPCRCKEDAIQDIQDR